MGKITDRIILILSILAAASILLSYLAPVVNPARVLIPALLGLAYPYLLLLNLIFLLYWLVRLKKQILIPLVSILLGWNHLSSLLPLHFREMNIPKEIPDESLIHVLSYNVRGFDVFRWSDHPQVKQGILRLVEEEDPDIVCFQEYYSSGSRGETHSDIARRLYFLPESSVYYTSDYTNTSGFGIATFSKFPIIKRSRIPFPTSTNAAMYTDILFRTDTLRVINAHLQSIRFRPEDYAFMDTVRLKHANEQMYGIRNIGEQLRKAFSLRSEQSKIIAHYVRESPHPVILMGDFNDTPSSYSYRKIKKGLHDAFQMAGRGFGHTYEGELPSFRIDYILYSNPLRAFQFRRIKVKYSDHYPISTWLALPVGKQKE